MEKIARITYNKDGWISPSGWEGKSRNKTTHEGRFGFGHEEWLFDFSKMIRGFQYGFIEGLHAGFNKHQGQTYDIQLFTIDNTTKQKFWVGRINNCIVLTEDEQNNILKDFRKPVWQNERINQLKELGLLTKEVSASFKRFLPTIKFRREDYFPFESDTIITDDKFMNNRWRYKLYNWNDEATIKKSKEGFIFTSSSPHDVISVIRKEINLIPSKEVKQLHRNISEALYNYLLTQTAKNNISCDASTGLGTYIDMVVRKNNKYTFYEIKTYNDIRRSIREAFGQLMEYAFWNTKDIVDEIIIVTDQPANGAVESYFRYLRNKFLIPVFYQQFDLVQKKLKNKI